MEKAPGWLPTTSKFRRRYALLSVGAPVAGLLAAAALLMLVAATAGLGAWPTMTPSQSRGATLALLILAGSNLVGLASAVAAFVRRERYLGLAVLGLVVNAPLPALFLWVAVDNLANWWRFG